MKGATLSLLGNLADLGLGDIFQIVSLSRRSGTLQLTTPVDAGEIVFDAGRVVAATVSSNRESIGDKLLARGVVSATIYQDMLALAASGVAGKDLFQNFHIDNTVLEAALEDILKSTIYLMFDWTEGTFSFVLEDQPDPWRGFTLARSRSVAVHGLNPQYLAIEGARLRDERTKHDSLESFLAQGRPGPLSDQSPRAAESISATLASALVESSFVTPSTEPSKPEEPKPATSGLPITDQGISLGETTSETVPVPTSVAASIEIGSVDQPPSTPPTKIDGPSPSLSDQPVDVPADMPTDMPAGVVAGPACWRLLVVDDDPQVTTQIQEAFKNHCATVVVANTTADALKELDVGTPGLVVATDLIIARSDGGGILGGIEIVERVRALSATAPVILFSDYENAEARSRATTFGVAGFLMKPRKAQIQPVKDDISISPAMQDFLAALDNGLKPFLTTSTPTLETKSEVRDIEVPTATSVETPTPPTEPTGENDFDLGIALGSTMAEVDVPGADELPAPPQFSGPMSTLRSMLTELVDPSNREAVTLLILRFASLILERAGLFLVTRRSFIGLGGFSNEEASDRFVQRIRKIQVPMDVDSVFSTVTRYRASFRGPLIQNNGNERLIQGLGSSWPSADVVAIPLVSNDRVATILYGDNPSGREVGLTESLEIFMQQAGLAMDRVLLERKLEETRRAKNQPGN